MKKKVAFLAHCLFNQNAKVDEYARCPGLVAPVVEVLRERGYQLQQLPCPELTAMGIIRWWQNKDQYDNPGYRRHCYQLAQPIVELFENYFKEGAQVIIVGMDGSPSSGVRVTGASKSSWGGRPEGTPEEYFGIPGKGVWIEELERALHDKGIAFPPATGIPMDLPGFDLEWSLKEFQAFLDEQEARTIAQPEAI